MGGWKRTRWFVGEGDGGRWVGGWVDGWVGWGTYLVARAGNHGEVEGRAVVGREVGGEATEVLVNTPNFLSFDGLIVVFFH